MTSYSSQLQAALDSLTPANWVKGHLFVKINNNFCMCAHGAIQAQCNPQVKLAIANLDLKNAAGFARGGNVAGGGHPLHHPHKSTQEIWDSRPDFIRQDFIHNDKNYGNNDLHWLLGMVGLTEIFNDMSTTTFEMVQNKFREAIKLAQELGV